MIVLLGFGAWALAPTDNAKHLMKTDCLNCHLGTEVTLTAATAPILTASQEALCAHCHPNTVKVSHPSGFSPSRVLPNRFPLDWKHDLTCSSCHLIHGEGEGLMRSKKNGAEFCLECHDQEFFERMADKGRSLTSSGHLSTDSTAQTTATATNETVVLDSFSNQCVECHTKKVSKTVSSIQVEDGLVRHTGGSVNHPIGMVYTNVEFGTYRPIGQLPKEIFLPDNKMGCVSCHVGYSEKHGGLVMSNSRSALCLTCHEM